MPVERKPFSGFTPSDFSAYLPEKRRDSLYNEERLEIKHKLHSLGEMAAEPLTTAGLDLDFKTSLSHPYTYNKYSVDSQWVYFARKERARRALKAVLGMEIGEDLGMHYSHVILLIEINLEGLELGLKIHQQAWWDGQNIRNRCQNTGDRKAFTAELNRLGGFVLNIHDWRREYVCGRLLEGDVQNFFNYYTPGNHWLHLKLKLKKDTVVPMGREFGLFAGQAMGQLAPVYRFIEWRPDNDHVFRNK
ncbi:MAG: hypothetical protein HYU36_12000 [Planctomycetes bacterium]|nr:hypothetical protein [Planctomycetota bacterium]